ncbi:hypothetical protein [Aneurinibacillus terranovensis]|uniref:hypothetical protein n=1 Tax=Aneurinibacillus terranovensis TaxID=278991 RepID=UPI0012DDA9D0|nr:hypothetical protein [Aneurinibacillus terranovensis]
MSKINGLTSKAEVIDFLRKIELPVYRMAFHILQSEEAAMEASRKALIEIYVQADKHGGDMKGIAWIKKIVVHICMDEYRIKNVRTCR